MSFVDNWVRNYCKNKWNVDPALVRQDGTIPPAKIYGDITRREIYDLMPKEYLNPNNNTTYKVRASLWDSKYKLTTVSELNRFLAWDKVTRPPFNYEANFNDCDDAAVMSWGRVKEWTRGLSYGLLCTNTPAHAKNVFVGLEHKDSDKPSVYEVEPQSNTLVKLYNKTVDQYFF